MTIERATLGVIVHTMFDLHPISWFMLKHKCKAGHVARPGIEAGRCRRISSLSSLTPAENTSLNGDCIFDEPYFSYTTWFMRKQICEAGLPARPIFEAGRCRGMFPLSRFTPAENKLSCE